MSALPGEWEQINGAELYKGQRPSLRQRKCVDGIREDIRNASAMKQEPTCPAAPPLPQASDNPAAGLPLPKDWEAIDEEDYKQASIPEAPVSARRLSQGDTGSPIIYSKGEPPAIQMQGLSDLRAPAQVSQPPAARIVPAEEQAAAVPADNTPLPPSSIAAAREPRVLRRLHAGDTLAAGDKLESSNGLSTAILQEDGNFVVYTRKSMLDKASKVAWSSGTYEGNRNRLPKGHELFAQDDGNLVLYTSNRGVAWASNTDTKGTDAYTLEVTDSGTLVWYCETSGEEVWTSRG